MHSERKLPIVFHMFADISAQPSESFALPIIIITPNAVSCTCVLSVSVYSLGVRLCERAPNMWFVEHRTSHSAMLP